MTTINNDPIDEALALLEEFNERLLGAAGEGRIAEMDADTMHEYLMRAVDLQAVLSRKCSGRGSRLAELALRHLVDWTADERDRSNALMAQLSRSLPL